MLSREYASSTGGTDGTFFVMKVYSLLIPILTAAALVPAGACGGSSGGSAFDGGMRDVGAAESNAPPGDGGATTFPDTGTIMLSEDGGGGGPTGDGAGAMGATLSDVQITPANDTITVNAGVAGTVTYKVMGIVDGQGPAQDVTNRFVFYVPDNIRSVRECNSDRANTTL